MPRGNPAKLVPNSARTPQQRREQASKAGKASVVAKRKQKNLREAIKSLLSQRVKDGNWEDNPAVKLIMESFGISGEDMVTALAAAAIINGVIAGSPQHAKLLADITAGDDEKSQMPAKICISFEDNSEESDV